MSDEGRALLTDREKEVLAGEADVGDNYEYKVQSVVRNRLRKQLGEDVEFLADHFEEAYGIAVGEVCEDPEAERGPIDDYTRDDYEALLEERDELKDELQTARRRRKRARNERDRFSARLIAAGDAITTLLDERQELRERVEALEEEREVLENKLGRAQERVEALEQTVDVDRVRSGVETARTALEGQDPDLDRARVELDAILEEVLGDDD